MARRKTKNNRTLSERYPPSLPCACEVCLTYCARPGWWTVEEATRALEAGYGNRMMLEVAPDLTFGVLSPAFKGCEGSFATNQYSHNKCAFLKDERCELYGTGHQPLECRFCHHERLGQGMKCHAALERDWNTPIGQALVEKWIKQVGLADRLFVLTNRICQSSTKKEYQYD